MSSDSGSETEIQKLYVASTVRRRPRRARLCGSGVIGALAIGALVSGAASAAAPTAAYRISLAATPSSITTKQPVTFTGTVSPANAGERPRLHRLINGRWVLLAVGPEVAAGGYFSVTHSFGAPSRGGPTSLSICFHRDASNIHTCSTFTVTIVRQGHSHPAHRAHRKAAEERRREHREEAEARRRREEAQKRGKEHHHQRRRIHAEKQHEKRKQRREEARQRRAEKHRK
jgi:hypothetical protein